MTTQTTEAVVSPEHAHAVAELAGTRNQDFTVLETRARPDGTFVALAYRRDTYTARNEYVTWEGGFLPDGSPSYYWGHYDLGAGALARAAADFESR